MPRVFIDGRTGTTGLRIESILSSRDDIELIEIDEALRKDPEERVVRIAEADVAILCLPDEEAGKIAALAPKNSRIIDASTAHRTKTGWVYGLPELTSGQAERIAKASRVAVPGCHATGFVLIARPLVEAGLVADDFPFVCHSITGYSGGGKAMIEEYEAYGIRSDLLRGPRQYALTQSHKHLPEMTRYALLQRTPIFMPFVGDYYNGIELTVPIHSSQLARKGAKKSDVCRVLKSHYDRSPLVKVREDVGGEGEGAYMSACTFADRNDAEIVVSGTDERIVITARYDNLGKGASGAAVQCLDLMLGE
jgi:N-acetyl-gamma-glutamyl-phosphate reductase